VLLLFRISARAQSKQGEKQLERCWVSEYPCLVRIICVCGSWEYADRRHALPGTYANDQLARKLLNQRP